MFKVLKKKGFTLAEILIVISILGILTLIAIASLSKYSGDAKEAVIINDIKEVDKFIQRQLAYEESDGNLSSPERIETSEVNNYISENRLYGKKGLVSKEFSADEVFYLLPEEVKEESNSNLQGPFIIEENKNEVFYYGEQSSKESQYDKEGYDKEGYDKEGYNKEGYDKEGYDKEGYDKEGYDKEGYDKEGYDKEGYDKDKLGKLEKKKLSEFDAGSVIMLGGIDWILLEPKTGYLVLRGKKGALKNGYDKKVDFDWNNKPIYNPASQDNIAFMLNQIPYLLPDYPKSQAHVNLIKTHNWNIGGLQYEDVYGKYWSNAGDGLSYSAIVNKESKSKVSAKAGLLSVSDVLKYSKIYSKTFGFEGVLERDFFKEEGSAWMINSFLHENNKVGSSPWSLSLNNDSSTRIISQGSSARSKSYAIPTIYVVNNVDYDGYRIKK